MGRSPGPDPQLEGRAHGGQMHGTRKQDDDDQVSVRNNNNNTKW